MLDLRATLDKLLELQAHGGAGVSVGTITEYAGIFPPDGWMLCDGRTVSRTVYEQLFDAIGTTFGSGDGSTTFNLPDLRNRFSVGTGDLYNLNNKGGNKDSIIPYHNHNIDTIVSSGPSNNTSGIQSASHTHTRGSMNITGQLKFSANAGNGMPDAEYTGSGCISAFNQQGAVSSTIGGTWTGAGGFNFNAANSWSGSTSTQSASHTHSLQSHTHTINAHSTEYVGTSDNTINANLPPYIGMNFIIFTGVFQTTATQTTWTLLEDRIQNSQLTIPIPSIFDEPITIDDDIKIKINQNATTGVDYQLNNTINILGWSDLVTNSEISFKGILSRMSHGAAVVGTIMEYAGIFPPDGWVVCDGRALSRTVYEELFDAIGTTYGNGDGSTTFNIPDMRGRVGVGTNSTYTLGSNGGTTNHDHTYGFQFGAYYSDISLELNSHSGVIDYRTGNPIVGVSIGNFTDYVNSSNTTSSVSRSMAHYKSEGYTSTGSNMQPYLAVNVIIYTGVLQTVAAATTWTSLQNRISNSQLYIPVITNFQDKIYYNGKEYWETIYPIGSYYETTDNTFNPNNIFGGTWNNEIIKDDVIIDEGISGIWTYRKWKSGIAECWGVQSCSVTGWQAWGNLQEGTPTFYMTYPSGLFNASPNVQFGIQTTNVGTVSIEHFADGSKDRTGRFYILRPNAGGTAAIPVGCRAMGTWKTYVAPTTIYKWHRTL